MRKRMSRHAWMLVAALTLSGISGGCLVRESPHEGEFHDHGGQPYRHARWHDEDVYKHEDGRWYAHRNGSWVVVEGVHFD